MSIMTYFVCILLFRQLPMFALGFGYHCRCILYENHRRFDSVVHSTRPQKQQHSLAMWQQIWYEFPPKPMCAHGKVIHKVPHVCYAHLKRQTLFEKHVDGRLFDLNVHTCVYKYMKWYPTQNVHTYVYVISEKVSDEQAILFDKFTWRHRFAMMLQP